MTDTKQQLAKIVLDEVMACIGCHDCMLACPLPEAQEVNIAELNDAVHQASVVERNVERFVSACTQCQQCVPACPADLSRANMVLYNKMKLEDATLDRPVMMQVGDRVQPSGMSLDGLAAELSQILLFAGVALADLRRLAQQVTLRALAAGELLHRRGEFHERMVVVASGLLEQTATGRRGEKLRLLALPPGSFFGELAVMADQPEIYDVAAVEASLVVEIPKAAALRLTELSPAFGATMDDLYRRRSLATHAERLFARIGLPAAERRELQQEAELRLLAPGEALFSAGDAVGAIHLVRSGFLRATSPSGVATVYFREGDVLGLLAAVQHEEQHGYAATASCRSEVITLPGQLLLSVLAKHQGAREALVRGPLEAERVARARPSEEPAPEPRAGVSTLVRPLVWEELVEGGVAQGTRVLVVDQTRCTHCRSCIDACGRRHGHSRLELDGLQLEHLLFPTACRHCDDPVCLLCSVNGIVRRPTGEIAIVEESCVGCGACASRCPYDNIRMHPVDKPKRTFLGGIWAMLGFGEKRAPTDDPKVPRVATKCDLCADYDDYACVTACPVGAAARVDPLKILA
jgi:Fe-S-cluster-containing dehydrogenase component/CRP-like cAMP-binding protein